MLTSVGARGSYLLEDVTVISTELVRLYRLLSSLTGLNLLTGLSRLNRLCRLCGLRGLRIVRRHCLGRFILTVVQAVLRGEYLSRRIVTRSVGGVLSRVAGLSSIAALCRVSVLRTVVLCRVAALRVRLGCAVTGRNTSRSTQCSSRSGTTLTALCTSRRNLLAEQEQQNQDEQQQTHNNRIHDYISHAQT